MWNLRWRLKVMKDAVWTYPERSRYESIHVLNAGLKVPSFYIETEDSRVYQAPLSSQQRNWRPYDLQTGWKEMLSLHWSSPAVKLDVEDVRYHVTWPLFCPHVDGVLHKRSSLVHSDDTTCNMRCHSGEQRSKFKVIRPHKTQDRNAAQLTRDGRTVCSNKTTYLRTLTTTTVLPPCLFSVRL